MFSRNNKKKMILLVSLIGVLVLSVGYAAITAVLNISANADLTANPNDFIVKFSSSTSSVVDGEVVPSYLSHDTIVAENAKIDNGSAGGVPMITNLYATIAEPGQSVSYTFYAHNVGKYDAYLTGVVFQPQASGSFITCDGGIDSSETMIKEACNSMSVTVRVESVTDTSIVTETSSTLTGITNHLLPRDKYEKVTVTLKYAENGKRVDGDFEVHFGDIYLSYGTSELAEAPSIPDAQYVCSLSNDVNADGIADIGDIITCGTEKFYVIPQDTKNHPVDDTTISMLAMYNLDVGTYLDTAPSPDTKYTITEETTDTYGIQNEIAKALTPDSKLRYGVIPFSDTTYWLDGAGNLKKEYWYSDTEDYPAFVYNENSNIYPYIEAYETYLRKMGVNSAVATVLNPSIIAEYGEYDWIENTTFWTGVCYGNNTDRISAGRTNVDPDAASQYASYKHSYANGIGIRPVVIIKKSELVNSENLLPSEYQQVEYIAGTGTQYIDTGYIFSDPELKIEIKYRKQTKLNTNVFGTDRSTGTRQMHGNIWSTNLYLGNSMVITGVTQELDVDYTFSFEFKDNKAKWDINGTQYNYEGNNGWTGATITDTLFGTHESDSTVSYLLNGRIYYAKYYDSNNILVRNFVPCYRKSDNVIGMYDLVENKFYTNNGSGTFSKGNDINIS